MQGLGPYLIRRLLWLPFMFLVVSFVTFAIARFGPGDPIRVAQGQYRDPEALERVRREKGLDKPIIQMKIGPAADERLTDCFPLAPFPRFCGQYPIYMLKLLQGDLGESLRYRGTPVSELIFPRLWISMQINALALIITFALGIPLGLYLALRQGSWIDPALMSLLLIPSAIPVVISVPLLLLVFSLKLHLLPAGWNGVYSTSVILPVLALSLPGVAGVARLMRATTLDVLGEEYVRTARAKGLTEFTVISQHVARNALLPLITIIGLELVGLLGGAYFTETLLGIPGIGRLAFESVTGRDYDVILAITLIAAAAFVILNALTDVVYAFIDPRVRVGGTVG